VNIKGWYKNLIFSNSSFFYLSSPFKIILDILLALHHCEQERIQEIRRETQKNRAMAEVIKPHVVCIPFPLQGHINPMLKIAKLLHHKGFHVTFVNTEFNHKGILDARGPNALDGLPDFCFETLPIEHPPSNSHISATLNLLVLRQACGKSLLSPLRDLIARLNDTAANPPVTCMVSDAMLTYTQVLTEELEMPNVFVWHMAATGVVSFAHFRDQMKQLVTLLKGVFYIFFTLKKLLFHFILINLIHSSINGLNSWCKKNPIYI
jgi:hypothetical protein